MFAGCHVCFDLVDISVAGRSAFERKRHIDDYDIPRLPPRFSQCSFTEDTHFLCNELLLLYYGRIDALSPSCKTTIFLRGTIGVLLSSRVICEEKLLRNRKCCPIKKRPVSLHVHMLSE